jgi:hypothetical protein
LAIPSKADALESGAISIVVTGCWGLRDAAEPTWPPAEAANATPG